MTLESNGKAIDAVSQSGSAITVATHEPKVAAATNEKTEGKSFESKFPVVGVAASAGGLAAFTQLLVATHNTKRLRPQYSYF